MANEKITELTALTATNKADLVAVVDDVIGSPVIKKATLNNALATSVDHRDFDEAASVSNPASGDLRIYAGTDDKLYSRNSSGTVIAIGEGALPHNIFGRLTLTSGTPVTTADVTAATSVYFTPYKGNTARMYDTALSAWKNLTFTELEWKATDTQTGDTVNGSAVITDLTDTSGLVVGMEVSGTGIGVSAVISTIDSLTQVTLDVNSTADGNDVSITFKAPVDTNYDMFLELQSGAIAFRRPVAWTDGTTRATALTTLDGVDVLTGDTDSVYIGTIRTTDTDGELEDSVVHRFVWNYYNQVLLNGYKSDGAEHTYASTTVRPYNNDTDNKVDFVIGIAQNIYINTTGSKKSATEDKDVEQGPGIDSSSSIHTGFGVSITGGRGRQGLSIIYSFPIGYHEVYSNESCEAANTVTFYNMKLFVAIKG